MAGQTNKPVKQQSGQPAKKQAAQSTFKLDAKEAVEHDPITRRFLLATSESVSMSGHLPSATEFAKYEDALPGTGSEIISMAKLEQAARLEENRSRLHLDEKIIAGVKYRLAAGQIAAASLVLVALTYGKDLAMAGHETAGIALCTTAIGSILTAFLYSKNKSNDNKPTSEDD